MSKKQVDFESVLKHIYSELNKEADRGDVASYIPELGKIDPKHFGIHFRPIDNSPVGIGDFSTPFSIQSICKVLSLAHAMQLLGADLWKRVGVDPTHEPFNFLSLTEKGNGIPNNPFVNAGALVICDMLYSQLEKPGKDFLLFVRNLSSDNSIDYDKKVYESEKTNGFRNHATASLLKSLNNLHNGVEQVLDFYYLQCSLSMSCEQLSRSFYFLMNGGKNMAGQEFLSPSQAKRLNAIMLTCGFYNDVGGFAFHVGLPAKSGVGGGIIAIHPRKYCIATWSPGLNQKGNSLLGIKALEMFTTETELSIF
ncbi:glutaminase [Flagellimonas oceanensis]|uniref:glutaminase n=1 Tax=Flagellimonas oceanensis TaxID=2499163 RepID=UPI003BA949A5